MWKTDIFQSEKLYYQTHWVMHDVKEEKIKTVCVIITSININKCIIKRQKITLQLSFDYCKTQFVERYYKLYTVLLS